MRMYKSKEGNIEEMREKHEKQNKISSIIHTQSLAQAFEFRITKKEFKISAFLRIFKAIYLL